MQKEGMVSFPVLRENGNLEILEFDKNDPNVDLSDSRMVGYKDKTYLSTISHLRLVCSDDGVHFYDRKIFRPKYSARAPWKLSASRTAGSA